MQHVDVSSVSLICDYQEQEVCDFYLLDNTARACPLGHNSPSLGPADHIIHHITETVANVCSIVGTCWLSGQR